MRDLTLSRLRESLRVPERQHTLKKPGAGLRRASVLIPVVQPHDVPELLFTRRTDRVETHKGQVSFPGGMVDDGDRDIVATALREAWEEVGIAEGNIDVLCLLDDLATPTGFIVTPVVGIVAAGTGVTINPEEVAEVFTVPLGFFADPANSWTERRVLKGREHDVWYYRTEPHVVWGVTAAIIRSLLSTVERNP